MARKIPLLEGEQLRARLVPHVASLAHLYFFAGLLLFWALGLYALTSSALWEDTVEALESSLGVEEVPEISLMFVLWLSMPLGITVLIMGKHLEGGLYILFPLVLPMTGLVVWDGFARGFQEGPEFYGGLLSSYTLLVSISGLSTLDFYRRQTRYYVTTRRFILSRKLLIHRSRSIFYGNIALVKIDANWLSGMFQVGNLELNLRQEPREKEEGKELETLLFSGTKVLGIQRPEDLLARLDLPLEKEEGKEKKKEKEKGEEKKKE